MLKTIVQKRKKNGWSQRKRNRSGSGSTSGQGRFINDAHEKELEYWKRTALESVSIKNEASELIELALRKVILVRKAKNQKVINIEEIIFYLKSHYLEHNPEDRTFISHNPSKEPSFESITDHLKTF